MTDTELKNIKGGASFKIGIMITAALIFVIGLFDGYIRPLKCNK